MAKKYDCEEEIELTIEKNGLEYWATIELKYSYNHKNVGFAHEFGYEKGYAYEVYDWTHKLIDIFNAETEEAANIDLSTEIEQAVEDEIIRIQENLNEN